MAVYTSEPVNPSLIENTVMVRNFKDGIPTTYYITPADGYVLHDNFSDWMDIDPDTMEETFKLGYVRGTISVRANYDFTANPREFYAVPETEIPADQIFGGVSNTPEVM